MKILYVVSTLSVTGPTNQLYALVRELRAMEVEISILTLSPEPVKSRRSEFEKLGVNVISNNLNRIYGMLYNKGKLAAAIELIKPDIIHSQGIRSDIITSKLQLGWQHFITIHNYPYVDFVQKFGVFKGLYMAFRHTRTFKCCLNNISCSKTIASQLAFKGVKSDAVQNGIEIDKFTVPDQYEKSSTREKLGIDSDIKVFIAVGSLIKRKNMKIIVLAFKKYYQDNRNCLLLIAGDGVEKAKLELLAGSSNIKFLGNIPNVAEYLQIADCFVSASRSEGLPYSVMEAMATGLPCILSDIPSHRELMETCTDYPFFFNCDDETALIGCFDTFAHENSNSLSERSRQIVLHGFTSKIMADQYYAKYSLRISRKNAITF